MGNRKKKHLLREKYWIEWMEEENGNKKWMKINKESRQKYIKYGKKQEWKKGKSVLKPSLSLSLVFKNYPVKTEIFCFTVVVIVLFYIFLDYLSYLSYQLVIFSLYRFVFRCCNAVQSFKMFNFQKKKHFLNARQQCITYRFKIFIYTAYAL